ncbi:MAG: hypothetical protein KatS3mg105_5055 [Gemmatales bacterium]|nr:MAG: hypothetical protein KatS3mg105_5055 [Gemmatales bacterium]
MGTASGWSGRTSETDAIARRRSAVHFVFNVRFRRGRHRASGDAKTGREGQVGSRCSLTARRRRLPAHIKNVCRPTGQRRWTGRVVHARFAPTFSREIQPEKPSQAGGRGLVTRSGRGDATRQVNTWGPKPARRFWTDLTFSLRGATSRVFLQVFQSDWHFATGNEPELLPPPDVKEETGDPQIAQLIPSGPDVPNDALLSGLLTATFAARSRILARHTLTSFRPTV